LKIRDLKRERTDLKTDLKRAYVGLKKMVNLEKDYNLLMSSFEESETLRNEQRLIIDNMRAEIKRLRQQSKKRAARARKNAFVN
jgi:uncharacterized Zn finger protein